MDDFTPLASLLGGLLIGLSATLLMLLHGRVAGISGIVAGALPPLTRDARWRWAFLAGMVSVGVVGALVAPAAFANTSGRSLVALAAAGLLVGVGTRLGGGCTSGHGVCGISRGARRSIAATVVFVASGAATVTAVRLLGAA